jgi:hypothetical protein
MREKARIVQMDQETVGKGMEGAGERTHEGILCQLRA